jgi:AmmeMemoRadiSam system protein A
MVNMADLLTNRQGEILLRLARKVLEQRLNRGTLPDKPDDAVFSAKAATFVTLKIAGKLRGCICTLEAVDPLWESVCRNTINAAFHDHRFLPLTQEELPAVRLDVSILSQPKPLEYEDAADLPAKLRPGIDGVILRQGARSATFLPQVWQQLTTPEQFLDQLCLKAGLPQDVWRQEKVEIHTYQVQDFEEERK